MPVLFVGNDHMPLATAVGSVLIVHSTVHAITLAQYARVGSCNTAYLTFRPATETSPFWLMRRDQLQFLPPTWMHSLRATATPLSQTEAVEILQQMHGVNPAPYTTSAQVQEYVAQVLRDTTHDAPLGVVAVLEKKLPPNLHKVGDPRQRFVRRRK